MSSSVQRTAIVTGGAAGIGLATTQALLRQGWRVAVLDRDAAAIEKVRAQLAADRDQVRIDAADVSDAEAMASLVSDIERDFGPIKGVATSAGVGSGLSFFETTAEVMRRMYEINVIGSFNVAKPAALAMSRNGGGAIVTISSVSGLVGNAGRTAYGASKGAVVNLTRIMAVELARHGIRVNSVAPGPIETAMVAQVHTAETRAQWNDDVLLKRYGSTSEIGEAVAFLLDDRSSYITGQILAVDGGFTAAGLVDKGWTPGAN